MFLYRSQSGPTHPLYALKRRDGMRHVCKREREKAGRSMDIAGCVILFSKNPVHQGMWQLIWPLEAGPKPRCKAI